MAKKKKKKIESEILETKETYKMRGWEFPRGNKNRRRCRDGRNKRK